MLTNTIQTPPTLTGNYRIKGFQVCTQQLRVNVNLRSVQNGLADFKSLSIREQSHKHNGVAVIKSINKFLTGGKKGFYYYY